ncbi:hypothetical protein PROVRUST_05695 [Providencia rustigianii DSM 4541]|uniref:Uncharacterized protein n=1 Tax=Providencia rustigianii DSM 4541 TaxID=500637 RepID=D1P0M8_9GAMM|nr:hypothetical protein PROVRUST_05695 [Providencia rustigianii DSM 4541]
MEIIPNTQSFFSKDALLRLKSSILFLLFFSLKKQFASGRLWE